MVPGIVFELFSFQNLKNLFFKLVGVNPFSIVLYIALIFSGIAIQHQGEQII